MTTATEFLATLPAAYNTQSRDASRHELVKLIRAELALAIRRGVFPQGTKFSVRQNAGSYWHASCGSISVRITRWPGEVFTGRYTAHVISGEHKLCSHPYDYCAYRETSDALRTAERNAQAIANRHNWRDREDASRDFTDVGYYLDVSTGGDLWAAARDGIAAESTLRWANR